MQRTLEQILKQQENQLMSTQQRSDKLVWFRKPMVAVVECTITALGPSYKPWDQQHPVSKSVKMVSQYVRDAKKGEDLDAKRAALGLDSLSSLRTRFERDRTDRSTRSCGPPVKRKASLK